MIADCEEDTPGKNPAIVQVVSVAIITFVNVSVFSLSLDIVFCIGICILSFNEMINVEVPKSPESKGNKGSFIVFMFKVIIPRVPDKIIINIAACLDFFSFRIRKKTERISK